MARPRKYQSKEEQRLAQNARRRESWAVMRAEKIANGWIPHANRKYSPRPKARSSPEEKERRSKLRRITRWAKIQQDPIGLEKRRQLAREWYYANKEQALKRMNEYHEIHRPYKTYEQTREYSLKYTADKVTYRRKPYGPRKLKEK